MLIPKLKNLLKNKGLQTNEGVLIKASNQNDFARTLGLVAGLQFIMQIRYAFVKEGRQDEAFLETRPDFYLGRLASMFANYAFPSHFGYTAMPTNDTDQFSRAIYTMFQTLSKDSTLLSILRGDESCISRFGNLLLPQQYETLLDIVKHSQLGNTTPLAGDRKMFFEKYVKNAYNLKTLNKAEPKYLENDMKFLSFCYIGTSLDLDPKSEGSPDICNLFQPSVTGKGLCQTFNGQTMKDVYKTSPVTDLWNTVFNPNQGVLLEYPSGHGPAHGLNIVLNMFKTISMGTSTKNSIMSITNAREWVSIFANNFLIEPGYSYTFKIIANQINTTDRLAELSSRDRKCNLPLDTDNLQLMREYSKGGCLYECAIQLVAKNCNCTPWNVPKMTIDSPPFCEESFNATSGQATTCHDNIFTTFSTKGCDCPSNCFDTTFTVFDFKKPLENPGMNCSEFAANEKNKNYPYPVFCDICRKALRFYKLQFNYKFLFEKSTNSKSANPADIPTFCNQFLVENIATIKVEIASPTLILSMRDKRFNFSGQLSDLGD